VTDIPDELTAFLDAVALAAADTCNDEDARDKRAKLLAAVDFLTEALDDYGEARNALDAALDAVQAALDARRR